MRLLLRYQITFPMLSRWLKVVYVDVAEREFRVDGKPQSDSRITLLTGIHRKEVKRLRDVAGAVESVPESVSLGASLVGIWVGDPRYLDASGRPKPLPRYSRGDGGVSFESLVREKSKDIRPRVVLDEWLRLGVCNIDARERVHLNTAAFVPDSGFDEKAFYFGRNVHDHIATCLHNLASGEEPRLERSVYYDRLTEEDVEALASYARELGMDALLKLNQKALELHQASKDKPEAVWRMTFGAYFHAEQQMEPTDAQSTRGSSDATNGRGDT